MRNIDLLNLKLLVEADLNSQFISGRNLLDTLLVIDESSRKTAAYVDHRYAPFYYHLGKYIQPESMIEIGFDLGLLSSCFLKSCHTVKNFIGFKEKTSEFISNRLGKANIRRNFKLDKKYFIGNLYEDSFVTSINSRTWDFAIINEETNYDKHLEYLDVIWNSLSENGIIVVEYIGKHSPSKEALLGFCKNKRRDLINFDTRYGTSIVQK